MQSNVSASSQPFPDYNPRRGWSDSFADEKNARQKKMIQDKTKEYMDRAEKLKKHLDENDESSRKKPSAMGSNGKASEGGKGK